MDIHHVTLATDDETNKSHTQIFINRNLFQCYHNNRGYCSFRDKCRYEHFQEICSKSVCRDKECKKRHPVNCRYKDDCKFYKMKMCAFKHDANQKTKFAVASSDLEDKYNMVNEEINKLKSELTDLKREINMKERELLKSKMEIEQLKKELTHYQESEKESIIKNDTKLVENVKKDMDLQNHLAQKHIDHVIRPDIETTVSQSIETNFECEKCCLKFSSTEKVKEHQSEMHKVKLTF